MLSRSRLLLAAALAGIGLTAAACGGGGGTFVDDGPGSEQPQLKAGWSALENPRPVTLPTRDPVGDAAAPDLGGPLLVNIWASFCEPCKKELPLLQDIDDQGALAVVGFTRDMKTGDARGALDRAGVTYANWLDRDAEVALSLDGAIPVNSVPSSFLVRDGKVVAVHIGEFKSRADVLAGLELK